MYRIPFFMVFWKKACIWFKPPGIVDPHCSEHVCKLNKALYGLKQGLWAWYHRLFGFLLQHGLICSTTDSSLFIYSKGSALIYLLVYVDDIIVTSTKLSNLDSLISKLQSPFAMKNLCRLNYFLGFTLLMFRFSNLGWNILISCYSKPLC